MMARPGFSDGRRKQHNQMEDRSMKAAFLIAALCAGSVPALAQQPPRIQSQRTPTTITPMAQSLTALLNDGWTIVAANGVWSFTLYKSPKWAFCGVDRGTMSDRAPTSECFLLN
jgi:hypothetical protein